MSKSQWNVFGNGYLLMPDPRAVNAGGEIYMGYGDGRVEAMDSYGRTPHNKDFGKENRDMGELKTLDRFKGEFAHFYGPKRRGRSFDMFRLDPEIDTDERHEYYLSLFKKRK